MAITNIYRWSGRLDSNWNALNPPVSSHQPPVQSNWDLISGTAQQPAFPEGAGDLAVFDTGGPITVTALNDDGSDGSAGAEEIQVAGSSEVTFSQDHFFAGSDQSGGMLVDEGSVLTLSNSATMANDGSLDIIGLTSDGTLVLDPDSGFRDSNMVIGAGENARGEVIVNLASGFIMAGSSFDGTTGVLTVGEDGDGTVEVSDTPTFGSMFAVLGKNADSSGSVILDDSTWGGYSLTIGLAGAGRAQVENGSTIAFTFGTIGPQGELDVTGTAGATSQVLIPLLALNFGTIDVSGGGAVFVGGSGTLGAGTVEVGGIPLVGLGTIRGDVALTGGAIVEAEQALPGVLFIDGSVRGEGTIEPVQTLEVTHGIDSGVEVLFNALLGGTGGELVLDTPGANDGTIVGFASGNTIVVEGSLYDDAVFVQGTSGAAGTLTLSGGTLAPLSFAVEGSYAAGAFVATPNLTETDVTLCFVAGTRIATPRGEISVDRLAVGDEVLTLSGRARPIVWIGEGKVLATRGRRSAATPVIVRRGALADYVPCRDLRITKGHSLFIDNVLIPVEELINQRSILWDDQAQEVAIYHLELATHDVLLADGAPAESYRDDGNRWLFRNANAAWHRPPQEPCAPVLASGPVVDAVWRRLLDRAPPRSRLPLTGNADVHLMVDGRRVDPVSGDRGRYVFRLPVKPRMMRIRSRSCVPQELGLVRDPRRLGIALQRLILGQRARTRAVNADDARLADGFHDYEAEKGWRWTNGDAAVPSALFMGFSGPLLCTLEVGATSRYLREGRALRAA